MIVDMHAHISNSPLWGLHVSRASVKQLKYKIKYHKVRLTVIMATYFPYKSSGQNNSTILKRIRGQNSFLVFGSLDIMNNFKDGLIELGMLLEKKLIHGIKVYPGYQLFNPESERIFPLFQLAEKYNVPVAIHTGELHHCCNKEDREVENYKCGYSYCLIDKYQYLSEPQKFRKAICAFPKVKFILSHLGNPYFEQARKVMKEFLNVYTDISGQFLSCSMEDTDEYRKELNKEILSFLNLPKGIKRVMFGTDFPIQSHKDTIELVDDLHLIKADRELIDYKNALEVLCIKENDL